MKAFVGNLLVALIAAVLGGAILYHYQSEKPDLRYSLSQKLPTSFSDDGSNNEIIQLLDLKNVGKSEATGIVIKTSTAVISYEIQKFSKSDQAEVSKFGDPLEIKYSSLPPGAPLKILIKTMGNGLVDSDLSIIHSKGTASDVFTKNNTWASAFVWGVIALPFVMFLLSLIDFAIQKWDSKVKYDTERVIESKKPFYIKNEKWSEIKKSAWEWKLSKSIETSWHDPIKASTYAILTSAKPIYLSSETWDGLINQAFRIFKAQLKLCINSYHGEAKIEDLLRLEKPTSLTNEQWKEIRSIVIDGVSKIEETSIKYYSVTMLENAYDPSRYLVDEAANKAYKAVVAGKYKSLLFDHIHMVREPYSYISDVKLNVLDPKDKKELSSLAYKLEFNEVLRQVALSRVINSNEVDGKGFTEEDTELLQRVGYQIKLSMLLEKIQNSSAPLKVLEDKHLSYLRDSDVKFLKAVASQEAILDRFPILTVERAKSFLQGSDPEWLNDRKHAMLRVISEQIISLNDETERYRHLLSQITAILNCEETGQQKPDNIQEDDFIKLKKLEHDIVTAKRVIHFSSNRNKKLRQTLEHSNRTISAQLDIINDMLNDPSAVDRIESYNNCFAPGNFANLKILAQFIAQSRQTVTVLQPSGSSEVQREPGRSELHI